MGDFTDPPTAPRDLGVSQSAHCSDRLINPHPRFATLTNNIRKRRGSKVSIKVPLFLDSATAEAATAEARAAGADPEEEVYMSGLPGERRRRAETIEMDCMAYGMGMCCLQVTFQARDLQESRHLYDQLAVLTPIFLALSAATPVLHGRLADTDVRWATIAASVDDRTPMERGQQVCDPSHKGQMGFMAGGGERTLPKSRYESISSYICNCKGGDDPTASTDRFNDIDCPIDEASYATLVAAGIDARLARHVAHLFVRDPLVIYSERIHIPDSTATDHFENIQSTNWQTVRWKPPPVNSNSNIGWRVEFRSMEVQLTPPPPPLPFPLPLALLYARCPSPPFLTAHPSFRSSSPTLRTRPTPSWRCRPPLCPPPRPPLAHRRAGREAQVLISRVLLAFRLNLYVPLSKVPRPPPAVAPCGGALRAGAGRARRSTPTWRRHTSVTLRWRGSFGSGGTWRRAGRKAARRARRTRASS